MDDSNRFDAGYADRRGNGVQRADDTHLLHGNITGAVIGAMLSVHRELGSGFLESVYTNALALLLRGAGLRVDREVPVEVVFHGERVGWYRADMIVEGKVLVEVKAGSAIHEKHLAQARNYLRASRLEVGLVLNFGTSATSKRIVATMARRQAK